MENVDVKVNDKGQILIVIDGTVDGKLSASGKSKVIASTRGNQPLALPNGTQIRLGINCFKPV